MTLAYLRKGGTYADLAAGFAVSVATAYRRVNETIDLPAARAAPLEKTLKRAKHAGHPFVIVDSTPDPDEPARRRPTLYSGKHPRHGTNIQAVNTSSAAPLWTSGALPGAVHDTAAAKIWTIHHLRQAGTNALADKGYTGLDAQVIAVPRKDRHKSEPKKTHNRLHARL